jgi:hypothetical protein
MEMETVSVTTVFRSVSKLDECWFDSKINSKEINTCKISSMAYAAKITIFLDVMPYSFVETQQHFV